MSWGVLPVWSCLGNQSNGYPGLPSLGSIGMGLKWDSVYTGKNFTLFTRKENTTKSFLPSQLVHKEEGIDEASPVVYLECLDTGTCWRNLPLRQSLFLNSLSSALWRKWWPHMGASWEQPWFAFDCTARESRGSRTTSGVAVKQGWLTGRKIPVTESAVGTFHLKHMDVTEHNIQPQKVFR